MKCWKCGANLPENASVCTYCGASTKRRNPVTAEGRAMRQAYDHFGAQKVLERDSILPVALGDLLENSKTLRNQVEMVMDVGVGKVYLEQLSRSGKSDAQFRSRVKTLMRDEAGLSSVLAEKLMGYLDEMIGWEVQAAPAAGDSARSQAMDSDAVRKAVEERKKKIEEARKAMDYKPASTAKPQQQAKTDARRVNPVQAGYAGNSPRDARPSEPPKAAIPMPNRPVPVLTMGCFALLVEWACIIGAVASFISGLWPAGIGLIVLLIIIDEAAKPKYPKKLSSIRTASAVEVSWEGTLDKYAIALGDKWVLTGSGTKAVLESKMFDEYKPGSQVRVILAEIQPSGDLVPMGRLDLTMPK